MTEEGRPDPREEVAGPTPGRSEAVVTELTHCEWCGAEYPVPVEGAAHRPHPGCEPRPE
jgi:hypothetical protein